MEQKDKKADNVASTVFHALACTEGPVCGCLMQSSDADGLQAVLSCCLCLMSSQLLRRTTVAAGRHTSALCMPELAHAAAAGLDEPAGYLCPFFLKEQCKIYAF